MKTETTRKGKQMASRLFNKVVAAVALVTASLALTAASAFADTTYGTVSSGNIQVKVPTEVPTYVCADGSVIAGEASITNEGSGDVIISGVSGTSDYSDFTLRVSTVSGEFEPDWFSFSSGKFNKPSTSKTLSAGESLATTWSVGNLDAKTNSKLLSAATTKAGAKLATVTYTFEAPVDFAIFSADDGTLRFYHRASVPRPGSTFDGHTATNVFEGIDNKSGPFGSVKSTVKAVDFVDKGIRPMKTTSWFSGMNNLTSIERLENLDTSRVTSMSYMFSGCGVTSLDLSSFDTSNVTDMSYMFRATSVTFLKVSKFNTSKVVNMKHMFSGCERPTSLDLSSFDTSNVTDMSYMFLDCRKLSSLTMSDFQNNKVTDMSHMFEHCESFSSLDLSHFSTPSATNMSCMFYWCPKLKLYNLSSFDTSKVTDMSEMFFGCSNLSWFDLSNFNTSNVVNMKYMFKQCEKLAYLNVSSFDTSHVTDMGGMFHSCSSLKSLDLSCFDTSSVTSKAYMFYNCGTNDFNVKIGDKWTLKSFTGSLTSTWYGLDGTSYSNTDGIDPAVNKVYYKTNPKPQEAVSETPVVTDDEAPSADSQLVVSVDLSTPTVLDTQQQGEASESDVTQEPETPSSDSTTESSQGNAVTEEASLQELPAAA